jgi:hypothetical protein
VISRARISAVRRDAHSDRQARRRAAASCWPPRSPWHDRAGDFGDNTTPQANLEFRPLPSLLLRASYAQAYRAPSLNSLFKPEAPPCEGCLEVTDPKRGNEDALATYQSAGNPR